MAFVGIYFDASDSTYKAGLTPGWNPVYKDRLLESLNSFGPVFLAAKQKSEFEFIVALLRVRGVAGPGWDPWENTVQVVEKMKEVHDKADYDASAHLWLWLYGHLVEASEPYEILANMLNIANGGRWSTLNFPDRTRRDGSTVPLAPGDKIQKLNELAQQAGFPAVVRPLRGLIDRNLRNAIFHSDYTTNDKYVRIFKPKKEYSHIEILAQVNHAIAYFDGIKHLLAASRAEYSEPKVIAVHPGFSRDPDEMAVVMVRRDEGVIGLRDNWTPEELQRGKIPFNLGRFLGYEQRMLNKDSRRSRFPHNRVDMANRTLKFLPRFISRRLVEELRKTDWF